MQARRLYVWPDDISLQAYAFNGSTFNTNPISQSSIVAPSGSSGGVLSLSAHGSTAGTGIVWSSMPISGDADHGVHQGVLRAFDANNLTSELWDSQINSSRDAMGIWPKYSPPTVVNGKVYMASFPSDGVGNTSISVYGLLSDFSITAAPPSDSVIVGNSATYTVTVDRVCRIFWHNHIQREWPTDWNDGGFFSGDVDGFRNFHTYGDDHREHAGRYLPADDHRDKRNTDAYGNGELGGECPAATTRLHRHGKSQHADGDRWKHDDVHGNDWSIERVRWSGDAKRDGVTDGSDAEFLAGDGDWGREHRH